MCIFDSGLAEIFGIEVDSGERHELSGATGDIQPFYVHQIMMNVGGQEHSIKAGFLKNIARTGYGIVGQKGFFDNFTVTFDLAKEEIELKKSAGPI